MAFPNSDFIPSDSESERSTASPLPPLTDEATTDAVAQESVTEEVSPAPFSKLSKIALASHDEAQKGLSSLFAADAPVQAEHIIHAASSGSSRATSAHSSRASTPARLSHKRPLPEDLAAETTQPKRTFTPKAPAGKGFFERSAQLLTHTFLIPATFLISGLSLMQEVGPYGLTSAGVLGSVAFAAIVIPRLLSSFKSATKHRELEKEAKKLDRGLLQRPTFKQTVGLALAATTAFVESFFVISVLEKGIESGVIASLSPLGAALTIGGLAIFTANAFFAARDDAHSLINMTLALKNVFTAQFWKDAASYLKKQGTGFYFGSAFSIVLPAAFAYLAATSLPVSVPVMAVAGALSFAVGYVGSRETLTSFFQNAYKDLKWFAGYDKTDHTDKWTKSPVTRYLSYLGGLSIGASVGYSVVTPMVAMLGGPIGIAACAIIGLSMYIFTIKKAEGYFGAEKKVEDAEELSEAVRALGEEKKEDLDLGQNKRSCLTQFSCYKQKVSTTDDAHADAEHTHRSCLSARA